MSKLISPPPELYGGKAAVLLELQSAGFRVPEFVVSPSDLAEAVNILGTPLAVRSSATAEDGQTVSFAGQFSSYLNLCSFEEIEAAVRKCRESVQTTSVVEYCRRNGVDPRLLQMEVIVQRMIQPELAGVAFTVNPVTGAEEVLVEASEGLADELLAGRKTALPHDHHLVKKYFPRIEAIAREIQRYFGTPQDIEFAIEDETLFILQSRPITRIGFASDIGEWTNADFRDGGVSSGACTPLMWSLYDFIWDDTLKGFLREIKLLGDDFEAGRMFFGRPYWNLGAVKQCLAKMPGFVEREFDTDLSVQIQYDGDGTCTPVTAFGLLRAIPILFAIGSFFKTQEQSARQFLADGFDIIERKYEPISGDIDSAFHELVERDYFTTERNYFRTIFAASFAKLDFKMSFPEADYTSLVAALPEMKHMAPIRTLREIAARGDRDVSPLVRKFRHHCRWGLDIREARWDEDREFVEELLCSLPASAALDPRPAYEQARADALSRLPARKRKSFNRKLDRLRTFVWLREEMRDLSSRMYYLIRRCVLEIAKRRRIADDIFFMTFREIFEDDRSNVDRNRETYESYRKFKAPNEIGVRFAFDSRPARGALRGIGASRGAVRGVARLARTVEEAMRIEAGAVLVCPFTEPGWIPVLDRVAGVVTETGGLLSHAAVICREYSIPAVLGVPGATQRIPDGRTVVVHGSDGYVDIVD